MAEKIRTVLVDDESASIIMLRNLLETYFPIIQIEGTAETVNEAVPLINTTRPELVFLGINLPDGEGFDVISRVNVRDFQIIFITAYDKYAVKAFEFSALHFIVKPVTFEGLKTAIDRFNKETKGGIEEKINVLRDTLKSRYEKIIISSYAGLNIIKISDVLRLEADDVYTLFYLVNGQRLIASKPLNNYERILVLCYV